MTLQLLCDDRSLRRRALFSSVSPYARDAERDHAARWFAGLPIVRITKRSAEMRAAPAAGVSGDVPPPGQTGDGEG